MAIRGRKPKPTNLKVLEGNPGKRPLPTNEVKTSKEGSTLPPSGLKKMLRGNGNGWEKYWNKWDY